jgi:hypothetical protein
MYGDKIYGSAPYTADTLSVDTSYTVNIPDSLLDIDPNSIYGSNQYGSNLYGSQTYSDNRLISFAISTNKAYTITPSITYNKLARVIKRYYNIWLSYAKGAVSISTNKDYIVSLSDLRNFFIIMAAKEYAITLSTTKTVFQPISRLYTITITSSKNVSLSISKAYNILTSLTKRTLLSIIKNYTITSTLTKTVALAIKKAYTTTLTYTKNRLFKLKARNYTITLSSLTIMPDTVIKYITLQYDLVSTIVKNSKFIYYLHKVTSRR